MPRKLLLRATWVRFQSTKRTHSMKMKKHETSRTPKKSLALLRAIATHQSAKLSLSSLSSRKLCKNTVLSVPLLESLLTALPQPCGSYCRQTHATTIALIRSTPRYCSGSSSLGLCNSIKTALTLPSQ